MTATTRRSGFFRTVLSALVDARQREADRHVNGLLLSLDDEARASIGYSPQDFRKRTNSSRNRS